MFAKVKNTTLVKYPYTRVNLRGENPYTRYDARHTLPEWYAMTEEGLASGNQVVEVKTAEKPEYDVATHYAIEKTTPELTNGEWLLGWEIKERPPEDESATTTNDPT